MDRFEYYAGRMRVLCEDETDLRFERGWLLVEAEQALGDEWAQLIAVAEEHGVSAETLRVERWVASRISREQYRRGLSWTHHRAVAALPEGERAEALDLAAETGMSTRELQRLVSAMPDPEDDAPLADPGRLEFRPYVAARLRERLPWLSRDRADEIAVAVADAVEEWRRANRQREEIAA